MSSVKYDINNLEDLKKRILELEKELTELKLERAKQRVKQLEEQIQLEKLLPFPDETYIPYPYVPMIRSPYQVGDYPPAPQVGDCPPYKDPNWPNQIWMSTDNYQPKSVPCQTGDSNARS